MIKEQVRGDAVQPTSEGARSVGVKRAEHPEENLLSEVFRICRVSGQAIGKPVDLRGVVAHDFFP